MIHVIDGIIMFLESSVAAPIIQKYEWNKVNFMLRQVVFLGTLSVIFHSIVYLNVNE